MAEFLHLDIEGGAAKYKSNEQPQRRRSLSDHQPAIVVLTFLGINPAQDVQRPKEASSATMDVARATKLSTKASSKHPGNKAEITRNQPPEISHKRVKYKNQQNPTGTVRKTHNPKVGDSNPPATNVSYSLLPGIIGPGGNLRREVDKLGSSQDARSPDAF